MMLYLGYITFTDKDKIPDILVTLILNLYFSNFTAVAELLAQKVLQETMF